MALVALAEHLTGGYVKGREQRRGSVPPIIVGAPLWQARPHRQHRLAMVQRLDLGLLVDAQHHRTLGRVQVHTDDVAYVSTNCGSRDSLRVTHRCGFKANARQIRPTVAELRPHALAIDLVLHCVASRGSDSRVWTTTQKPPPPLADRRARRAELVGYRLSQRSSTCR